jgi:hypothetical protein
MRAPAFLLIALLSRLPAAAEDDDWGAASRVDTAQSPSEPSAAPASPQLPSAVYRQIQLMKIKANGFYRARKFREACGLYGAIARLDTSDAAVRNDLGLCYQKLGFKDSALAYTRAALRIADRSLASQDPDAWSFPDLRARKSAYFNLDKLGGPMHEPKPGQCETWSSFTECPARLHVCAEQGRRAAAGGSLHWDILRAGITRAHALFSYDEVEVPSQIPHPEMRDMEEMSIDGVPESKVRWINRDSSVVLPLGEFLETADSACAAGRRGCGDLEKERIECRVIHFEPCAGVIGVACGIEEEGGKDRILIGEYYLVPGK